MSYLKFRKVYRTHVEEDLPQAEPYTAALATHLEKHIIRCDACPRLCHIRPGALGFCGAFQNTRGELIALNYAKPAFLEIFPILRNSRHFHKPITDQFLMTGFWGCTWRCSYCTNYAASHAMVRPHVMPQYGMTDSRIMEVLGLNYTRSKIWYVKAEDLAWAAHILQVKGISVGYTDVPVAIDYIHDLFAAAHEWNLKTLCLTNGWLTKEAVNLLAPVTDGVIIGLKDNDNAEHLRNFVGVPNAQRVWESAKELKEKGVPYIEFHDLIFEYSKPEEVANIASWIKHNIGSETPLGLLSYIPMAESGFYRGETSKNLLELTKAGLVTSLEHLEKCKQAAIAAGLEVIELSHPSADLIAPDA